MKALVASAALVAAAALFWLHSRPQLPNISLRDGSECRVLQISYTAQSCDSTDHNLGAAKGRLWLYRHLPSVLQQRVPEPPRGVGDQASDHPVLSIWWAHIDPKTHKPELGEAGDVLMTDDSGRQRNLGWPDPAEDYRQIFITDPPTNSKQFTFEFPVRGEPVSFKIDNPAYRPMIPSRSHNLPHPVKTSILTLMHKVSAALWERENND